MSVEMDKLTVEGNFLDRLAQLERRVTELEMLSTKADYLDEISGDLGTITSGEFRVHDDNGKVRMVINSDSQSVYDELGVKANFVGANEAGVPQFWISSDTGEGNFGMGDCCATSKGLILRGRQLLLEQYVPPGSPTALPVEGFLSGQHVSAYGMGTSPAFGILQSVNTPYTEYVRDPSLQDQNLWLSAISSGSAEFDSDGHLILNGVLSLNQNGILGLGNYSQSVPFGLLMISVVGSGSIILNAINPNVFPNTIYMNHQYYLDGGAFRTYFWCDTAPQITLEGYGVKLSFISLRLIRAGYLSFSSKGDTHWVSNPSIAIVRDYFCSGGTTSGTIGELGWLRGSYGYVSKPLKKRGISLSSGTTANTSGQIYLSPGLVSVNRLLFLIKPVTSFSSGGYIAVGCHSTGNPSTTNPPPLSFGALVYADNTSSGYWFVLDSLSGGGLNTYIPVSLTDITKIELIRDSQYLHYYINDIWVGARQNLQGFIMAYALTNNTTAKSFDIYAFEGEIPIE